MTKPIKNILPSALAVLIVMLMTAAAEFSGEKEILFPEIAAIAAGALIAPEFVWKTSKLRLFVLICIGSVIGLLISMFVPLPASAKLCIAFLLASLLFQFSGTTFAPVISSVVLPVMLGTNSVIYPIAAAVLTLLILAARVLIEKLGISEKSEFTPVPLPDKAAFINLAARLAIGCTVIVAAMGSGLKFAAAPPLLVAFTEFCRHGSAIHKRPAAIAFLIIGCSVTGALCRFIFQLLGWKMFIAAGLTMLLVCILMKCTRLFVPPAAALSVLAFLIPAEMLAVYPLHITAGTGIFVFASLIYGKSKSE